MLGKIGLIVLAIIQVCTALSALTLTKKDEMYGIKLLTKEYSIYRYILASLWISVSVIYILGSFSPVYYEGATMLAIVNIILEIISYWAGYRKNRNITKYYPPASTIVMTIPLVMILMNLFYK